MRIARLQLTAFGAFVERDLDLPAGPAVIVGPNEAGKSTLFAAVTTLLYGFRPANERDFPYVPRAGGRRAELAAELTLDDGSQAAASRRLLSSPVGRWQADSGQDDVGNHPLPPAGHIQRDLYEALYALSIEDMAALEGKAFQEVEERLLGGLGNPWHRPARAVAGELDEAAKGLWRRDRRGSPRHRELGKALKDLREQLRAAQERQEALRGREAERAQVVDRLTELSDHRARLADRIKRSDQLGQLRTDLARLDRLAEGIGDTERVVRLGEDPGRDWRELTERAEALATQCEELAEEVGRQRSRRERVTAADRGLAADAEAAGIAAAAAKAEEAAGARERAARTEAQAQAELRERAEAVLSGDWADRYGQTLEGLVPAELRDRAAEAEEARTAVRDAERRIEDLGHAPQWPTFSGIYLVLPLALAAALGVAGAWWWPMWVPAGLALLVGTGAAAYNLYVGQLTRQARLRHEGQLGPLQRALDDARSRQRQAQAAVAEALGGLPLPRGALETPGADLAGRIEALRGAWLHYRDARAERLEQAETAEARRRAVVAVLERHGLSAVGEELAGPAQVLERQLAEARQRLADADAANAELERLEPRCRELADRLGALARARADLAGRIHAAVPGEGDVEAKLERAGQMAADLRQWQADWRSLRERYPEVADPRAAVAEAGGDLLTGAELERAREELERLDEERRELDKRLVAIDGDLEAGRGEQDVGLLQGRISEVEAAMAETEREHDRLRLAESLVREADRRFREAHQPDVLRRAGAYLERVTGGRYPQLDLDDDVLRVRDAEGVLREVSAETAQLSRGTRDQVFLALRLAVADHLDAGFDRLPLLLDEVFVHWDPARQAAGLAGLRDMAGDRQVLLFTCHPELGSRMAAQLGTEPVELDGPS